MNLLNRSVLGFLVFAISICFGALLAFSASSVFRMHPFGDKTSVLFPVLVGIPLGCALGSATNLKMHRPKIYENRGILVAAAIVGALGAMLCVVLADALEGKILLLSPFIVSILSFGAFCFLIHSRP